MTENIKKEELKSIIYVSWEESERGWGIRPDGCSLHLTEEDFRNYEKWYWKSIGESYGNKVPDEYSRPAGRPITAYTNEKLYEEIKKSKDGLRFCIKMEEDAIKNKELIYGSERSGWISFDSIKSLKGEKNG